MSGTRRRDSDYRAIESTYAHSNANKLTKALEEASALMNKDRRMINDNIDWDDKASVYFERKENDYYRCIEKLRDKLKRIEECAVHTAASRWHSTITVKSDLLARIESFQEKCLQINQFLPFPTELKNFKQWMLSTKHTETEREWGRMLKKDSGSIKLQIEELEKTVQQRNETIRKLFSQQTIMEDRQHPAIRQVKKFVDFLHSAAKRVKEYLNCFKQHLEDFEHNLQNGIDCDGDE
uniref:Tektin n=1 Tax=Caenorhabditis tropicalis TaxID=1561998 RepID=A0A1I7V1T3_9PELO